MMISVVVPVYGCPEAVSPLCNRLISTLSKISKDYEIVLVNDACPHNSWAEIEKVCGMDKRIIGINLSRNFGQERAISAGLDFCHGDWVVVMDCDLQDRPEGIIDLYNKAQEGYDVVFARRKERKDTWFVKFLSKYFYKIYDYFTEGTYDNSINNFGISKREIIEKYCLMREQNRTYTLFLKWLGYRQTSIDIEGDERFSGESSYNFRKKLKLGAQMISAQSNKPLVLSVKFGFLIAVLTFVYLIYRIIYYFFGGEVLTGWTSLIVSLYFLSGVILIAIGVLGIYIGYIFNEVKNRPLYVIKDIVNGNSDKEHCYRNFTEVSSNK